MEIFLNFVGVPSSAVFKRYPVAEQEMRQVFSWSALIKTRFVCHDLWGCGPSEEPLARKSADVIKNCSLFAFCLNPAVSDVVLQE